MKNIIQIVLLVAFLFISKSNFGQLDTNWITINNYDNYFTFKIPDTPIVVDTINLFFCNSTIEDDIVMQVYYAKADSNFGDNNSDSINNPLLAFTAQFIYSTNGTLTSIDDIDLNSTIRGKEVGITYTLVNSSNNSEIIYVFARIYHNGNSLLIFYISSNENRLADLVAYKEVYFDDIVIYIPN